VDKIKKLEMKKLIFILLSMVSVSLFAGNKTYYVAAVVYNADKSMATYTNVISLEAENTREAQALTNKAIMTNEETESSIYVFANESKTFVQTLLDKKIAEIKNTLPESNVVLDADFSIPGQ
jgi:hypothetical protein